MEASRVPRATQKRARLGVPYRRLGDEALARLVGQGAGELPFAALYERYSQPIHGYCRMILQNEADAQDAVQTTFASAFGALREGRRNAPPRPWLYRIAHNAAISILRRRHGHGELNEELVATGFELAEHAAERERLEELLHDLRALPERQRSALVMRELSGLSHTDIASALGTSVGTAKQAIYEARRSLDDYAEGRAMSCDDVCRLLSNGDRRVVRSRRVAAHLRDCPDCERFAAAITQRSRDLRALAPVAPAATGAFLLQVALGRRAARLGGSAAGGSGSIGVGAAGKSAALIAGSTKLSAGAALVATVALGTVQALGPPATPPARQHGVSVRRADQARQGAPTSRRSTLTRNGAVLLPPPGGPPGSRSASSARSSARPGAEPTVRERQAAIGAVDAAAPRPGPVHSANSARKALRAPQSQSHGSAAAPASGSGRKAGAGPQPFPAAQTGRGASAGTSRQARSSSAGSPGRSQLPHSPSGGVPARGRSASTPAATKSAPSQTDLPSRTRLGRRHSS